MVQTFKAKPSQKNAKQKQIQQSTDGSLGYTDQTRLIDTLHQDLKLKKRAYYKARRAWKVEAAKDPAYATPSSSDSEDN